MINSFYYTLNNEIYKVTKTLYSDSIMLKLENYKTEITCVITTTNYDLIITMKNLYNVINKNSILLDDKFNDKLTINVLISIGENTSSLEISYPIVTIVKPPKVFSELDYISIKPIVFNFNDYLEEYQPLDLNNIFNIDLDNMDHAWYRFNIDVDIEFKIADKDNNMVLKLSSGDKYKIITPKFRFNNGNVKYDYLVSSRTVENIWLPVSNDIKIEVMEGHGDINYSNVIVTVDAVI